MDQASTTARTSTRVAHPHRSRAASCRRHRSAVTSASLRPRARASIAHNRSRVAPHARAAGRRHSQARHRVVVRAASPRPALTSDPAATIRSRGRSSRSCRALPTLVALPLARHRFVRAQEAGACRRRLVRMMRRRARRCQLAAANRSTRRQAWARQASARSRSATRNSAPRKEVIRARTQSRTPGSTRARQRPSSRAAGARSTAT